ncbi:TRAP transporter small permease [Bacillus sp. Marseille-P3661]|uniref:TRAP transporter small permease n=1 Tax=Bacillus sp. Marseille-P3661 TaxID=1936234 RepID=UPI0015E163DB|nr:TRAP transporter small permease [Bacillus sp. Marseille-P3661]
MKLVDLFLLKTLGYLLIIMTVTVIAQVFCRYVLNSSLVWSEELARYIMIWIGFLGAACGLPRGELASLTFIREKVPKMLQKLLIISCALLLLMFEGVLLFTGIKFILDNVEQVSPSLGLPMYVPYAAIPFSSILMIIYTIQVYSNELFKGKTNPEIINGGEDKKWVV